MTKEVTIREKRLIAAMTYGIYIHMADGHRWIECGEDLDYPLAAELQSHGVRVNNKIYGGYDEALDVIDIALRSMDLPTLEQRFDAIVGGDIVTCKSSYGDNRVDTVEAGKGGVC